MKRVFAVTGGIACGKSTVARFLSEFGCGVLDTDDVAHRLQAPSGGAVAEIVGRFGAGVLAPDGAVDRRLLGRLVFSDAAALADLNAIMHPRIAGEVAEWVSARPDGTTSAVLVPLLFEAGLDASLKWDAIVAVVCSPAEQLRRICGRGFREDEARARIAAQMPCEEKAARADYVIENDGTLAALKEEVARVLRAISSP